MEKKVNENVNEIKETAQAEMQVVEQQEQALKLFVERESFIGNDGKQYWAYITKGQVRGRDVKIDFAPKDKGGYEPLDIVFSINDKAELIMTKETMTDANGTKTSYTSYKVRNADELGELECGVKPSRDSDKALLTMLINQLKATANK
ncbi:MAG: hypothetical protein IJY90_01710 [Clostridia bacterium]|nr:hypothetical protein [Clostridia bacterium]